MSNQHCVLGFDDPNILLADLKKFGRTKCTHGFTKGVQNAVKHIIPHTINTQDPVVDRFAAMNRNTNMAIAIQNRLSAQSNTLSLLENISINISGISQRLSKFGEK